MGQRRNSKEAAIAAKISPRGNGSYGGDHLFGNTPIVQRQLHKRNISLGEHKLYKNPNLGKDKHLTEITKRLNKDTKVGFTNEEVKSALQRQKDKMGKAQEKKFTHKVTDSEKAEMRKSLGKKERRAKSRTPKFKDKGFQKEFDKTKKSNDEFYEGTRKGKRSTDKPGKPLTSRKEDVRNKQKAFKSKTGKLSKELSGVRKRNEGRKHADAAEMKEFKKSRNPSPPPPKGPDMGKPGIKNKYIKQMTGKKGIGNAVGAAAVLVPAAVSVFKKKFDDTLTKNDARLAGQVNERARTRKAGIVHKARNEKTARRQKALGNFKKYINE